jgi:hypothetical protein
MKSDNPVFQIVSLLLMFGPIVFFWYIDWYWIVGYYNLFFTYTCYVLYKQYDNDSNYRRKYHFIVYVGLPLIFSFIGLLISVINGFEEIREGDKDFVQNKNKKLNESNSGEIILKSNEEIKLFLENISEEEIKSFSVDILYDKWTFFEEIDLKGNFKGFDFILKGGAAIKWSRHKGCYKNDIDGFLSDINSKEIHELDFQSLNYDCEDSDEDYDYNFYNKIIWNQNTSTDIIKEVEENYSENDFEKLRNEIEFEEDYLGIELFQKKGFINNFDISVSYKNKVENLKWVRDEDSDENNSEIDSVHFLNKQFIEGLGKLNQSVKKEQYQKEAFKLWKEFFEKQLNDYFKDWQEGYWSDDYEFEISDKGEFLIQDVYTTVKYFNDEVEYVHFKLIYNDENETEEGYLSIGFPFIFLNNNPYILFDFPHDYNNWTDNFGNHKELFKSLSFNEVCKKLSMMEFISYQNWKITEDNNPIEKKNEVIEQYKIKDDNPSSMDSDLSGTKLFKRDITGLMSYFEERPNMERLFNELTHFTRDGYTVEEYLDNTNFMDDEEVKTIIGQGFIDISGFLEDMLKIEENFELRKDYESCLKISKFLLKN